MANLRSHDMMTKKEYVPECLCESHARALNVIPKYSAKHVSELEPDEDVECEKCFEVVMRRFGVA